MIKCRRAIELDRKKIAYCIAEAYENDFKELKKTTQTIANALESGIQVKRFYVAEEEGNGVVGILAISDSSGRSVLTDKKSYKKSFGFIKGSIVTIVLKDAFEKQLEYSSEVGYIEFVGVLKSYQRRGITTKLLDYAIEDSKYSKYDLEVTNINVGAYKCYEKYGFKEYRRISEKKPKRVGFEERIYMNYNKSY